MPVKAGPIAADAKSAETETILSPPDKELELDRASGTALVGKEQTVFAVITDSESTQEGGEKVDDEAVNALSAVRAQAGLGQAMSYLTTRTVPRFGMTWGAADLVAITADRPALDASQRRELRSWLNSGGKLVVFADQVENDAAANLIGEAWNITQVDKVTLTQITFARAGGQRDEPSYELSAKPAPFIASMTTEDPITMARVLAPGWDVHLNVRGWPALLSRTVGRGKVFVVTVGGRAWTAPPVTSADGKAVIESGTGAAMEKLSALLVPIVTIGESSQTLPLVAAGKGGKGGAKEQRAVREPEFGRTYVGQLIGYKIVSRQTVAWIMGGFLGVLVLGGIYWQRKGLGERLGVVGVGVALAASVGLIGLGQKARGPVEPTYAALQQILAQPGLSTARGEAIIGMYSTTNQDVKISGSAGGWLWVDILSQAGDRLAHTTQDLDRWVWSTVPLSDGSTRPATAAVDLALPKAVETDLQFGAEGLTGTIDWPVEQPVEDLLLATSTANLQTHAKVQGAGAEIRIGPGDVLQKDVFFSEGLLSQAQRDRAETFGQLMKTHRFEQPTILGWSKGLDFKIQTESRPPLRRAEDALWFVPLQVRRNDPGDEVVVPWPFVRMQQARFKEAKEELGLTFMPLYRAEKNEWIQNSMPSAFMARFLLPTQVLPLKLTAAKLHLNMTAVGRPVRIFTLNKEFKVVELKKLQGPDGAEVVDLPVDQLAVDGEGGVLLGFDVQNTPGSDAARLVAAQSNMWSVKHFGLEVAGTVEARK